MDLCLQTNFDFYILYNREIKPIDMTVAEWLEFSTMREPLQSDNSHANCTLDEIVT